MPTIHGVALSPYVRKVHVMCHEKGIEFTSVPLAPMNLSTDYLEKSPLGKIPLYEDDNLALPDSTCICLYLEKVHPSPSLYPADPALYGRALFLEEYADTKLTECTGGLFFQIVVGPNFMGQPTNEERVKEIEEKLLPPVLDYLEKHIKGAEPAVGGHFSIADIAIGSSLINLEPAGKSIDAAKYPKLAAYAKWITERPSFARAIADGKAMLAPR